MNNCEIYSRRGTDDRPINVPPMWETLIIIFNNICGFTPAFIINQLPLALYLGIQINDDVPSQSTKTTF